MLFSFKYTDFFKQVFRRPSFSVALLPMLCAGNFRSAPYQPYPDYEAKPTGASLDFGCQLDLVNTLYFGSLQGSAYCNLGGVQIQYETQSADFAHHVLDVGFGYRGELNDHSLFGVGLFGNVSCASKLSGYDLSVEYLRRYFKIAFVGHGPVARLAWNDNRLKLQVSPGVIYQKISNRRLRHTFMEIDCHSLFLNGKFCEKFIVGVQTYCAPLAELRLNGGLYVDIAQCLQVPKNPLKWLSFKLFLGNRRAPICALNNPADVEMAKKSHFLTTSKWTAPPIVPSTPQTSSPPQPTAFGASGREGNPHSQPPRVSPVTSCDGNKQGHPNQPTRPSQTPFVCGNGASSSFSYGHTHTQASQSGSEKKQQAPSPTVFFSKNTQSVQVTTVPCTAHESSKKGFSDVFLEGFAGGAGTAVGHAVVKGFIEGSDPTRGSNGSTPQNISTGWGDAGGSVYSHRYQLERQNSSLSHCSSASNDSSQAYHDDPRLAAFRNSKVTNKQGSMGNFIGAATGQARQNSNFPVFGSSITGTLYSKRPNLQRKNSEFSHCSSASNHFR